MVFKTFQLLNLEDFLLFMMLKLISSDLENKTLVDMLSDVYINVALRVADSDQILKSRTL